MGRRPDHYTMIYYNCRLLQKQATWAFSYTNMFNAAKKYLLYMPPPGIEIGSPDLTANAITIILRRHIKVVQFSTPIHTHRHFPMPMCIPPCAKCDGKIAAAWDRTRTTRLPGRRFIHYTTEPFTPTPHTINCLIISCCISRTTAHRQRHTHPPHAC